MAYPYPDCGCWTWYAPNALVDEWTNKIKLVKTSKGGMLAYRIEGLPCWNYSFAGGWPLCAEPNASMTTYDDAGCWRGICQNHSIVYTAILQERTKGEYHIIDGVPLKAVSVDVKAMCHKTVEIYIKDKGYFMCDVSNPNLIAARSYYSWNKEGLEMGNRFLCTGDYTDTSNWGYVPYKRNWAGEPPPYEPPTKSYIACTTSPTGARIWLKKK